MTEQQGGPSEPAPEWVRQGPATIEAAPAAKPKRRRIPLFWPALILLAAVAALVVGAPYWASRLPWAGESDGSEAALARIDQRLGEVTRRQAALEQRLGGIEERLASAAPPAQDQQAQQEAAALLRQLSDRLSALEQRPAAPAGDGQELAGIGDSVAKLTQATAALGARLDKLEAQNAEAQGRSGDATLLLALGQLRGAVESGRPFSAELATVRSLAQGRPDLAGAIDALGGSAASGVASTVALAQRFTEEVAPALLRAGAPPESDDIGDRVLAKLRSLVVIHRIGDRGDAIEIAVERAEAALKGNDLAGAVTALADLPAQAPARDWLATARQRLAATQALDALAAGVTAQPAATPAPAH